MGQISNTDFADDAWEQASLPVYSGGLGIRKAISLSLPTLLSLCYRTKTMVELILPDTLHEIPDLILIEAEGA